MPNFTGDDISGFWKFASNGERVPCDLASVRVPETKKLAFHPKVDADKVTGTTNEDQSKGLLTALDTLEDLLKAARRSNDPTYLEFFSTGLDRSGNLVQARFMTERRGRKPALVLALADAPNRFGFFAMTYATGLDWREQVRELLA
jgi:hypothetical protein